MKKMTLFLLLLLSFGWTHGQTTEEWTRQRKTQLKYLKQQIAALQIYIGCAQKGVEVVRAGLNTIGDIKDGEFKLHHAFFDALKAVNPKIRAYARLAEMIGMQIKMVKVYQRSMKSIRQSGQLTITEMNHIEKLSNRLLDATTAIIEELIRVVTHGDYKMKDDERMRNIERLQKDLKEKAKMMQAFAHSNEVMAVQRMKEANEVEVLRKLYGL